MTRLDIKARLNYMLSSKKATLTMKADKLK